MKPELVVAEVLLVLTYLSGPSSSKSISTASVLCKVCELDHLCAALAKLFVLEEEIPHNLSSRYKI